MTEERRMEGLVQGEAVAIRHLLALHALTAKQAIGAGRRMLDQTEQRTTFSAELSLSKLPGPASRH